MVDDIEASLDDEVMDVALERFLRVGIRRCTVDEIARDSGIDPGSLRQRFAGKDGLVEAVLAREMRRMLAELTAIAVEVDGADTRIEEAMLHVLFRTRFHRLVAQVVRAPEEPLTYFTRGARHSLGLAIDYIARMLAHAQDVGLVDRYDPRPVAELIARLAHSAMLTPNGGIDFTDTDRVQLFVRAAVVPIMKHGLGPRLSENRA